MDNTPETLIARLEALIAEWEAVIVPPESGGVSQRGLRGAVAQFVKDLRTLRDAAHALSGATPAKKCIECGAAVTDGAYDLCRKCEDAFNAAEREASVSTPSEGEK